MRLSAVDKSTSYVPRQHMAGYYGRYGWYGGGYGGTTELLPGRDKTYYVGNKFFWYSLDPK